MADGMLILNIWNICLFFNIFFRVERAPAQIQVWPLQLRHRHVNDADNTDF